MRRFDAPQARFRATSAPWSRARHPRSQCCLQVAAYAQTCCPAHTGSQCPAHMCSRIKEASACRDPRPLRPLLGARGAWRGGRRRAPAGRRTRWTRLFSAGSAAAPSSTISHVSSWAPAAAGLGFALLLTAGGGAPAWARARRRAGQGQGGAASCVLDAAPAMAEVRVGYAHLNRPVQRDLDSAQLERQHMVALQAAPRPPASAPRGRPLGAACVFASGPRRVPRRMQPRAPPPRRRRACTDSVLRAAWRTRFA